MASKKYKSKTTVEADKPKNPKKELLQRIRDRFKLMQEADETNRREALADMKFVNVPGEQWDPVMKKDRGTRPCYEFNKLRITCKRVINDMRANRPAVKVRGVEGSDKETASIYEGLIRNIWNVSDGDTVIDQAAEYQVSGGMGAWRITTRYVAEDAFEQEVVIEAIQNPFCLYADPACKDMLKRDARDFILTEKISHAAFEARWPKAAKVDWEETEFDDESDWSDDEFVRIAEYWYKEPYEKELLQLATGEVVDGTSDEAKAIPPQSIVNRRKVICDRVRMCIASGDSILEEADWAGSHLPFVIVYGETMVVDGKVSWWGLPRFGKDAQRSYNISRTSIDETIALAPQAKWWATVDQAKGNTQLWDEAHNKNYKYLTYNHDPKQPGPPQRMPGVDVPAALMAQAQMASEDIKSVTGIFDASLGNKGNETSGVAINARQQQGEIATFNYMDNLSKGIRRTGEIFIDLIPKVYDTERELRILGNDGAEDYKKVNQVVQDPQTGKPIKVNDLAQGRYDVAVTVGPSWSTKRQEAAEVYTGMAQANPMLQAVAGDLVMKAMDLPYSEEIAERLKAMLPPQIQQMLSKDKQLPPEAQAAMQQATQAMQMVEQNMQQVQQAAQQVQQDQAAADKTKAEIQIAIANLKAEKAEFEATVAKQMAQLVQKDAAVTVKQAQQTSTETVEGKQSEFDNASQAIQAALEQFMQAAGQILETVQQTAIEQQMVAGEIVGQSKQRVREVIGERVNGQMVARPVYEEQPSLVKRVTDVMPQPPPPPPPKPRIVRVEGKRGPNGLVAVPIYEDQPQG